MISQCAGCSRFIQGTVADPVITGKALRWKNYHDACAKHEHARLARTGKKKGFESVSLTPSEMRNAKEAELAKPAKKTQFHVQCVLMTKGKEENRWHNIVDTMDEAEKYCEKQMAVSDFDKQWEMAGDPGDAGVSLDKPVCNASPLKYVNCTISMMMTSGKSTVIDERIHPMALSEIEDESTYAESSPEMVDTFA